MVEQLQLWPPERSDDTAQGITLIECFHLIRYVSK